MDNITRIDLVDIELNSGSIHRGWLNHSIGTADAKANAFGVRVFRDGEPVALSGGSVQGYFRDSQGNNIALTSHGTISDNVAYVTLPQACYNYDGQFTLAIKLINSSLGITGTMRIVDGMVDNTNTGGAVAPTGTVPTYQEVLSVYENMVDTLEDYEEVVTNQNEQITNLKSASSEGTNVFYSSIKSDTGTADGIWVNLTDIDKEKIKNPCRIKIISADGVDNDISTYGSLLITYTDSSSTATSIKNLDEWVDIVINPIKTVYTVALYLKRANSAKQSSVTSTWKYVIEQGFSAEEYFNKAENLTSILTTRKNVVNETLFNNSTTGTVWFNNFISATKKKFYIAIGETGGVDSNVSHLGYVNIAYSNGSSENIYIDTKSVPVLIEANTTKTVSAYNLVLYRANSSGETRESWWDIVSFDAEEDGDVLFNGKYQVNKIDDLIMDGTMYGLENNEYIAKTTTENWQAKTYIEIEFAVNENDNIWFGCEERHGLGKSVATVQFFDSNNEQKYAYYYSTDSTPTPTFYGGFLYNLYSRIGCTKCKITFYGISNASSTQESSVIGEKYYIHNAFAFVGDLYAKNGRAYLAWKNKFETIRQAQGDSLCFAIQTDTHFRRGLNINAGFNLSQLSQHIGMDFIANLGDVIQGYDSATIDSHEMTRKYITEIIERYTDDVRCPVMIAIGNHDANLMYAVSQGIDPLPLSELYARMLKPTFNTNPNVQVVNGNAYYYTDFPAARVVVLNTNDGYYPGFGVSQEQLTWLSNIALNTDKPVAVFSHVPLVSGVSDNYVSSYADVVNALKTFKNNGGELIGCFFGHVHQQTSKTEDGIIHIGFTEGFNNNGNNGELVMVNTSQKTITTVGLGGVVQDRSFSYT